MEPSFRRPLKMEILNSAAQPFPCPLRTPGSAWSNRNIFILRRYRLSLRRPRAVVNVPLRIILILTVFLLGSPAAMAAATAHASGATAAVGLGGRPETILIVQIVLLLLAGRGLGEIMQHIGQPAVIGQLLAGIILGPSLFGWVWPAAQHLIFATNSEQKALIAGLANIGVMLLLLLTGMETDLKLVRKIGAPALMIAAMGILVPFACGLTLGWFLPPTLLPDPKYRLSAALFLGIALSISSIKIAATIVHEMNFMRRNLGQLIVAAAMIEDTMGWVLVSVTLGTAGGNALSLATLARPVIGTALFLLFSYTVGRKLVYWLIRWVNDNLISEYAVVTAILIVMGVMALITQAIGVNTVLGAFIAGVLVGDSPILSQHIEDQLRGFITAFMMPIFFGMAGLAANLTVLRAPPLLLMTGALIAIASVGKFAGAFLGGRLSGLSGRESLALGCGMNARGSTEIIIAGLALEMGVLSRDLFTMVVTMATVTTMAMPPMLRRALQDLPADRDEKARLEREEIDIKGFVSRFERLLIVADESGNGKFATSLVGFIAGRRGKPLTVIQKGEGLSSPTDFALKSVAAESAEKANRATQSQTGEHQPDKVEVSTRAEEEASAPVVAEEATKGYDILMVGLQNMYHDNGTFSAEIERFGEEFDGPLALAFAGNRSAELASKPLHILVGMDGTAASRRGAEMALAFALPEESHITILHIASPGLPGAKFSTRRSASEKKAEKAVAADIAALARRYGHPHIETITRMDVAADIAILKQAKTLNIDLIVIGANRHIGGALYLGQTVSSIMERWAGALVLVAS